MDDSIGNTPTTGSWRVWGYKVGLGWRLASSGFFLLNNVFSWTLFRHSAFVRFDKPIFEAEKPFENVCTKRPPLLALRLVRMQQVSTCLFERTNTCSRQAITGYTLEFSGCILLEASRSASRLCDSKKELESGSPAQNAGPKMRPFSELSGNMLILRGTKSGFEFRANF